MPISLRRAIDDLLARKQATGELGTGPAIPEIDAFLATEFERLTKAATNLPTVTPGNPDAFDAFLQAWVIQ
jgi:hypothetical protein